ncbi:transposase, partial [Streptomyces sp. 900105755]
RTPVTDLGSDHGVRTSQRDQQPQDHNIPAPSAKGQMLPDAALAVWGTEASVSDNTGGIQAWADTGYRTKVTDHGARLGIDVEVLPRDPGVKGFKVVPRRWVVERTFGWRMHHRRLAREYETHPHCAGAGRRAGGGSVRLFRQPLLPAPAGDVPVRPGSDRLIVLPPDP